MIFAVLDPSPLTVCINCSFLHLYLLFYSSFEKAINNVHYYDIFRFCKMAATAILDFRYFKILTVGTFNRVELHLRAKFCQNRSNRGQDIFMAIFRFFKMAAAAILDFQNFKFLTPERSRGSNCISVPNFVKIGWTAAEIWRFFDLSRWRPPPSWIFKISKF